MKRAENHGYWVNFGLMLLPKDPAPNVRVKTSMTFHLFCSPMEPVSHGLYFCYFWPLFHAPYSAPDYKVLEAEVPLTFLSAPEE